MPEVSLDLLVEGWLNTVQIDRIGDWDVLMFVYRNGVSLFSAEQIALSLGHRKSDVGKALDTLGDLGFLNRSRSSRGIRIYRFVKPQNPAQHEGITQLLKLSEKRSGRLVLANSLRKRELSMQVHGVFQKAEAKEKES